MFPRMQKLGKQIALAKMRENTLGRVTFLTNLMLSRLEKFDGPIFEGA